MAVNTLNDFQRKVLQHARAEPKKAMILAVLVTAVGVMWTRIAMFGGTSPSAAAASRAEESKSESVVSVINPQSTLALAALSEWNKGPIAAPSRNVFEVKLEYFPQDGSKLATSADLETQGIWDALAKSQAERADQEKARRILMENLQAQAGKLELQSTVMSNGTPKALVNGTLVGEGDTVGGFRVVRIEARRLIVEKQGVKLEVVFNF